MNYNQNSKSLTSNFNVVTFRTIFCGLNAPRESFLSRLKTVLQTNFCVNLPN